MKRAIGFIIMSACLTMALISCGGQSHIVISSDNMPDDTNNNNSEKNIVTIDPFENVSITFEGFDGHGECYFDVSDFYDSILNGILFQYNADNLSNGDTVTVEAVFDNELLLKNGYKVSESKKSYTVSGLKEIIKINPFEGLKITSTGISPFVTCDVNNSSCDKVVQKYVDFIISGDDVENGNFYNDIVIKVTAVPSGDYLENNGYELTETVNEYTISGHPEYITSLEGLDLTDMMRDLQGFVASTTVTSYYSQYFLEISTISYLHDGNVRYWKATNGVELQKSKLLTIKPNYYNEFKRQSEKYFNKYVFLYKVSVLLGQDELYKGNDVNINCDFFVCFTIPNIVKYPDGKLGWGTNNPDMYDMSWTSYKSGYNDMENMELTSHMQYYNINDAD